MDINVQLKKIKAFICSYLKDHESDKYKVDKNYITVLKQKEQHFPLKCD